MKRLKKEKLSIIKLKAFNWNLLRILKTFPYISTKITNEFFDELEESIFTNIININFEDMQIKG